MTIRCAASAGRGRAARVPRRAREVASEGGSLRARAHSGARAVPAVLLALEDGGIPVDSVTVARPSLDDVYLRYAGRSFEAAA
jgi:ABC-2 type transport system ATP-binding protein